MVFIMIKLFVLKDEKNKIIFSEKRQMTMAEYKQAKNWQRLGSQILYS